MTLPVNKPRTFRLQFSLRMLLLLMAVVGVGLTIFRWPWVDVEQHFETVLVQQGDSYSTDPFGDRPQFVKEAPPPVEQRKLVWERRTSYRRNWRGAAVKHGPAEFWIDGKLRNEYQYYENQLHGRRRVFDTNGDVTMEESLRGGLLHGPFRGGNGLTWHWQGNYEHGSWHGRWRGVVNAYHYHLPYLTDQFANDGSPTRDYFHYQQEPLVLESEWQQGLRHGHWRWLTPEGKVLRKADFQRDELVRWNDQPVVAEFRQWLNEIKNDEPELVESLVATQGKKWQRRQSWEERLCFHIEEPDGRSTLLAVHMMLGPSPLLRMPAECGELLPYLCEIAARNQCLFEARYGSLWLVGPDGKWSEHDSTGIAEIKFPAGSRAEHDWQERIELRSSNARLGDCLTELLRGTEWTCDVSAVEAQLARVANPQQDRLARLARVPAEHELLGDFRRCDALGLTLFLTGCRCEMRENKLIVTPRSEKLRSEPLLYPHIGTLPLAPAAVRIPNGRIAPKPYTPGKQQLDPF
jgi:hypothetical protein